MSTEDQIPPKRKKRTIFILSITTAILICLLMLLIFFYVKNHQFLKDTQLLEFYSLALSTSGALLTLLVVPRFLSKNNQVVNNVYHAKRGRRSMLIKRSVNSGTFPEIGVILKPLQDNMQNHITKLQNNSIVNLTIGIIGTIIAVTVLSLALNSDREYKTIELFALNFIPRVSFVVLIQLFAFFFLRLYKSNLEDSKYFQNELTNILAKTTALNIGYQQANKELISDITKELSQTERNFKLTSGETLLNIEKAKIEKDFDLELLNVAKDFFKNIKQKSE